MSYRGSIHDHQFHIRPEATTTFGETIAMYFAQYFDLHPPQRGAHGQQFHFFTLHNKTLLRGVRKMLPILGTCTRPAMPSMVRFASVTFGRSSAVRQWLTRSFF